MALAWIVAPGSWPSYRKDRVVLMKDVVVDHAARPLFPVRLLKIRI